MRASCLSGPPGFTPLGRGHLPTLLIPWGGSWGLVRPRASWSHAPATPGLSRVGAEVKSLIFHPGGFKPINKQPCFSLGASLLFQPLRPIPKSHIPWPLSFPLVSFYSLKGCTFTVSVLTLNWNYTHKKKKPEIGYFAFSSPFVFLPIKALQRQKSLRRRKLISAQIWVLPPRYPSQFCFLPLRLSDTERTWVGGFLRTFPTNLSASLFQTHSSF